MLGAMCIPARAGGAVWPWDKARWVGNPSYGFMTDDEIADVLMRLAYERGTEKTFCPSEAAQRLASDWRPLMPRIRQVAATLPLRVTQKGEEIDISTTKGAIRLSLRPEDPA